MYDHHVARQEKLYAGPLLIDGGEVYGEVWHSDGVAVAYLPRDDQGIIGPMRDVELNSDGGALVLMGTVDGEPVVWKAAVQPRVKGTWRKCEILFDGGSVVQASLVTETTQGVVIESPGDTYELQGAKVRTLGGRSAQIVQADGPVLAMTLPKRGCGCSGGGQ